MYVVAKWPRGIRGLGTCSTNGVVFVWPSGSRLGALLQWSSYVHNLV